MSYRLSDHERAVVIDFQTHGNPAEVRRANIILLSEQDASTIDIVEAVGLSGAQVRYWRREWNKHRLGIFPEQPIDDIPDEDQIIDVKPGHVTPRLPLELSSSVGIRPDDPMAEAGRKALLYHFERMLQHEPGSRLGENIEAVHDMRVATRRMRSAITLFAPFFKSEAFAPYQTQLHRTARALGAVRDLDVFMENIQQFQVDNSTASLAPLIKTWKKRWKKAHRALIDELDTKRFKRFVTQFHSFLTTSGKGAKRLKPDTTSAYQVRHIAPRLIYEHYQQVRAYETVLDVAPIETLHALRIDFKRFRYTLEFFSEVLGSEVKSVINETKIMQDHLGDLNDTQVAGEVLGAFIDRHNTRYSGVPTFMRPDISGVLQYAVAQKADQRHLLDTFPTAWANFNRDAVRRKLALAVAAL